MPIPKKVLLVVNPIAGDQEKDDLIDKITGKSKARGFELIVYKTDGKSDRKSIEGFMRDFAPDRVLVAGGDGTINQVADMLREHEVVLGLLPLGSSNGLARNLGISDDLDEAIEIALGSHTARLDGLSLNGHLGLHLSDLGLNARLIKNYEASEVRGKWGYAKEVIHTLTEHELFRAKITTDTETYETEATMVIIGNATMYGTGVVVNPHGDMGDGKFEIITATHFDIIELGKLIAGSTELDPEVVKISSATHAEVECLDKKVLFQVDGEFLGAVDRVKAQVLPGMLVVAVPATEAASE